MYTLDAEFMDKSLNRTFGIFTSIDKAKAYVQDALKAEVKWSDPKSAVTGGISTGWTKGIVPTMPDRTGILRLNHLPVDPAEFSNDLRYGLVN